ncbi:cytochrome P450 [Desarmillaria ectypa]|nr:cytochrome P450 [Desarmillaria ectypa]
MDVLASVLVTLTIYLAYKLFESWIRDYCSPLQHLRGPPSPGYVLGNIQESMMEDNARLHDNWKEEYGPTMRYNGPFNANWLYTSDVKALQHVMLNVDDWPKPDYIRYMLSQLAGPGSNESSSHFFRRFLKPPSRRRFGCVQNPAFGTSQLREMTSLFVAKSILLRDNLARVASEADPGSSIDVLPWVSRMTLDIIGLAGFGYDFGASNAEAPQNKLTKGLDAVFRSKPSIFSFLKGMFPSLRILPFGNSGALRQVQTGLFAIGRQLIVSAKKSVNEGAVDDSNNLISLLIRSNTAKDLQFSQRLSDKDVLAQIPTLLIAGHETSSSAITWSFYVLCAHPESQKKLRDELLTLDTDTPTMDQLNSLPYLEIFIRETLRIFAPVQTVPRVAAKDDILPLDCPVTDKKGIIHRSLRIVKGQGIMIPVVGLNTDKSIWGEDAADFKPERWENLPETVRSIPGVWANTMSFFGGPRSCIGFRFSIIEMKAALFSVVRAFELELAVPIDCITKRTEILQHPMLKTDPEKGAQLPLLIRPYVSH